MVLFSHKGKDNINTIPHNALCNTYVIYKLFNKLWQTIIQQIFTKFRRISINKFRIYLVKNF